MKTGFLAVLVMAAAVAFAAGCKSIHRTTEITTTKPDGTIVVEKSKFDDESFTLGFSEGAGKTVNLPDVSVVGGGL